MKHEMKTFRFGKKMKIMQLLVDIKYFFFLFAQLENFY